MTKLGRQLISAVKEFKNTFKIFNYEEREALKNHEITDECGEFPYVCEKVHLAHWHRLLDYIYRRNNRWSPRKGEISYSVYVTDDVKPSFIEYKTRIEKGEGGGSSYLDEYYPMPEHKKRALKKLYVVKVAPNK